MDSRCVDTRLGPLWVHATGAGPTTVLWHSLFADSTTWTRVADTLSALRRLLLIDGPGHGANQPPTRPMTLEQCASAAIDVLDHFGVGEPVDWLGNAWGGHVGILFASAYPSRIRSLMAVGSPVRALSPADRRRTRLLASLYRIMGARPLATMLTGVLLGASGRAGDPEGAAIVSDAFCRANRWGMLAAIKAFSLNRPDLTPVLKTIAAPTVLTTGNDDPMWTVAQAEAAVRHLPHGGHPARLGPHRSVTSRAGGVGRPCRQLLAPAGSDASWRDTVTGPR